MIKKHRRFIPAILLFLLAFVISCKQNTDLPIDPQDISTVKTLSENHKNFIVRFHPGTVEANNKVMVERAHLINLRDDYNHVIKKKNKLDWINDLAQKYRFEENFFCTTLTKEEYIQRIDTMLFRVDYIPEKLIMAQAIIESGWGGSKFSKEINNYFGIHCYTRGCGRPPANVENPKFWVKAFPTVAICIEDYLRLLNSGFAYEELRQKRAELRKDKEYPNAILLAQGLEKYSEKGNEYIQLIESIINNYLPKNLDEFVRYHNNENQILSKN